MEIDRSKHCPFLLRCFWNTNRHNAEFEYSKFNEGILPRNEVQIYTWPDASLRELFDLLKDVIPEARKYNAVMEFNVVYIDRSGNPIMKKITSISANRKSKDDDTTLDGLKYQIGDYFDIAVFTPKTNNPNYNHNR